MRGGEFYFHHGRGRTSFNSNSHVSQQKNLSHPSAVRQSFVRQRGLGQCIPLGVGENFPCRRSTVGVVPEVLSLLVRGDRARDVECYMLNVYSIQKTSFVRQ